ncbi:ABC transporter permease [Saccharococcus caldoxylosilyticus]|jgi:ABC-2 type transport system permease protein|uniref:Putative ABC transporter permease protein n=1 Tax=Parageobacillus caldoxylosilyticus NBRC 107762 TaxID=1220594 RepID=A0A023DCY5_9BACL|nr:ABC transporter permease [Parageobacillus caldoxylosilyticus]MBB3851800.1 ABC-2 type transport system permease protein [Parageobacillus caldoxylosilyticus]GAJ38881.1 putative ABC transporter permease protein [Parageobacillus caldoxylosilyticus NBRC 107762]
MRTIAVVRRIFQQMLRDKRTLALMFVAPLLILTLFHFLFTSNTAENPKLGVANADDALVKQLKDKDITVITYERVGNAKKTIVDDQLDGFMQIKGEGIQLTFENSDPSKTKALQIKIQQVIAAQSAKKQASIMKEWIQHLQKTLNAPKIKMEQVSSPKMHIAYVYGNKDTSFFDVLSPVLVGFFVFFFVFLISGIALLRERTTGTLERLMATPIRRSDIVFGYLLGYGLFAVIQTVIVVFFAVKVLDIMLVGSLWHVIIINLLLALVALSLGILLSAFANSEFQMMQFIPIVIIPQVFFAGILPVEGMANWLQMIAKAMPMYYGGDALKSVMYKGVGLGDIRMDLFVLFGFALLFITLNVFALKKYRKI